jgi:hypothetical protein
MESIKSWPKVALIALVGLALGVGAVALYKKSERTAEASALPNAARIDRVNGEVGLNRSLDGNSTDTQWLSAAQNTPISVGDRIYTKDRSDASLAFTGRNFARLDQNTSLDVLTLADQKTQVALRDGSALFDIGNLSSGELFEIATPCGAVDLNEPGLYQVEITDDGNATATALSGAAQVAGQGSSGRINKGELLSIPCDQSGEANLSRVETGRASQLVDHYYRYRYPRTYDGRYSSYDSYLNDPFYYEPSRRYVSYQYASDYIPGIDDLDYYGDWQQVADYGYCWHPRVDTAWAPYQEGYWTNDYPYGLTWVSSEPWGYAPYHYGRWSNVNNEWFWVPDRARTVPVYSPALVAFVPLSSESIGWVALGPGDPYVPRYYDANWNPRYLGRTPVIQERVVNINVPGAVTVVNVRNFDRGIDRRVIERVDARQFAQVRPVLDPLAVRNFREMALRAHGSERRIDLPARASERLERPVVASAAPATPFRRDLAQRFQVRAVADNAPNQRWQFRDNRQGANAGLRPPQAVPALNQGNPSQPNVAAEQARERQMADLSREAARGNRAARQQMRQLQQQQRQEQQQQRQEQQQQRSQVAAQEREQRMAAQQAQGERVSNNVQNRRSDQSAQPSGQQAPRGTRGNQMMVNPPRNQGQQPNVMRNTRRQEAPQAQPRDRQRPVGPPQRPQVNRAQPQVQPPQAAPQPRVLREQRQQQRKHEAQPRPQMQRQPAESRQQPQPRPQVKGQPQQMRQQAQPPPQQAQPERQPQQKKNERRPPDNPPGTQPQGKKGRGHP